MTMTKVPSTPPPPPSRKARKNIKPPMTKSVRSHPMTRSRRIQEENELQRRLVSPPFTFVPASVYRALERKLASERKKRESLERLLANPDQLDKQLVYDMIQESKRESLDHQCELESRISALLKQNAELKERNQKLIEKSDELEEKQFDKELAKKARQETREKSSPTYKNMSRENERLQKQIQKLRATHDKTRDLLQEKKACHESETKDLTKQIASLKHQLEQQKAESAQNSSNRHYLMAAVGAALGGAAAMHFQH